MLEKVRKPSRAKGILAYIIFGAIILVFIGFGVVPDRYGRDASGVAAIVNQSQISLADFRDRVQAMEQQYRSRLDEVPASQRTEMNQALRSRALEDLIQFEAMVQGASDRGFTVADEEVRDYILEIPAFQEEGRFKRSFYDQFLQNRQWTAGQFEERIRKDLVMRKLQGVFQSALKPSQYEVGRDQQAEAIKLNLEVATFNEQELGQKIPSSAAEVKAFLASPENVDKVRKTYDENISQYQEPEQVRARHILLRVDPADKSAEANAKAKIEQLALRAEKEDFAQLAKENSEDPGSKDKGGDLGYFSRERMVKEFADAAFATATGKISAPIKSDFGYHLIKVEDHKPAQTRPFEEVQNDLAKAELAKSKVASVVKELGEKVASGNEGQVRSEVKTLGLDWVETGKVGLDATRLGSVSDPDLVIEAVVNKGVRKGLVPEIIKANGEQHIVVVKEFAQSNDNSGVLADYMSSRKHMDVFGNWAKGIIAKAKIKRNSTLLAQ